MHSTPSFLGVGLHFAQKIIDNLLKKLNIVTAHHILLQMKILPFNAAVVEISDCPMPYVPLKTIFLTQHTV